MTNDCKHENVWFAQFRPSKSGLHACLDCRFYIRHVNGVFVRDGSCPMRNEQDMKSCGYERYV